MECKQKPTKPRALFSAIGLFKTESPCVAQEALAPQTSRSEEALDTRQAEAERARALGMVYYYTLHDTRAR